jgi:hypothetical protein
MRSGVVSSDWVVSVCSGAGVTGSGAARSGGVGAGATGSAGAGAGDPCRHILIGGYVTRQAHHHHCRFAAGERSADL